MVQGHGGSIEAVHGSRGPERECAGDGESDLIRLRVLQSEDCVSVVCWRDRALFVSGVEVDAFADKLHVLVDVLGVDNSSEYFSVGQGGRYLVVRVVPGLEGFVRPECCVVSDAIDSCYWDFVAGGGAGVDEEFAEVVDLSGLLFLCDSESSRGYP